VYKTAAQMSYSKKTESLPIIQQYIQEPETVGYIPKNDIDSIIDLVLKLPWREQEDFIYRQTILLISTARFNDMECIALLLAALKQHKHRNFVILVLDHIFE
jgi:hypothetical protein